MDKNMLHWKYHITNQLKKNNNLYAEIEMHINRTRYEGNLQRFADKYYLYDITKRELFVIIQNICEEENLSYIISTRSCGDKSENFYYIVLSIIQYSKDKND